MARAGLDMVPFLLGSEVPAQVQRRPGLARRAALVPLALDRQQRRVADRLGRTGRPRQRIRPRASSCVWKTRRMVSR